MFQESLQAAVLFMSRMENDQENVSGSALYPFLRECTGWTDAKELGFLSGCMRQGLKCFMEVENQRRFARLPKTLADPPFVTDLRRGQALRSLRRIYLLSRLESVVSDCLDEVANGKWFHCLICGVSLRFVPSLISMLCEELGYEQLAQRGCQTSSLPSLGLDLKARLVTSEEMTLALHGRLVSIECNPPAGWWDRTCDLALVVGTFLHGLGNYDSMLNDGHLPFGFKISQYVKNNTLSVDAQKRFESATVTAKNVFDAALEASKIKAQKEVQKAVAAAAAASQKREKDAALLREGGTGAEAIADTINEERVDNLYDIKEGEDAHFITLVRMRSALVSSSRQIPMPTEELPVSSEETLDGNEGEERPKRKFRLGNNHLLTMPDARVLNFRLSHLLAAMDKPSISTSLLEVSKKAFATPRDWPTSKVVVTNYDVRNAFFSGHLGASSYQMASTVNEYAGIGMCGSQCATSHRSLDDRADYSVSAASRDLDHVASGSDSARYLRALGVPMTFGRLSLIALVNAEEQCLDGMLRNETQKYFGEDDGSGDEKDNDHPALSQTGQAEDHSANDEKNGTGPEMNTGNGNRPGDFKAQLSAGPENDENSTMDSNSILVPQTLQGNAALRSSICLLLSFYGCGAKESTAAHISSGLWTSLTKSLVDSEKGATAPELFESSRFMSLLAKQSNDPVVPAQNEVVSYIETCFLPHCLKLCLYGNGSSTRDARGSKGKYDTFDGISRYNEAAENLQSPLPDPCLSPQEHSIEAIGLACAILRRCRLMRCILKIASGGIPVEKLNEIARSPVMRQSMDGVPVWWCPWIHDIALLLHASTRGLFSVVNDRENLDTVAGMAFSRKAIVRHIQSTLLSSQSVGKEVSAEDMAIWAAECADEFPSLNVMERRLAFLCSLATEHLEGDSRYHNYPMYDHGAWPRN